MQLDYWEVEFVLVVQEWKLRLREAKPTSELVETFSSIAFDDETQLMILPPICSGFYRKKIRAITFDDYVRAAINSNLTFFN